MRVLRVGLVTCARLPDLTPDDRLLLGELRRRGADARPVVWDDASVPWTELDRVVLRSCWDYHVRPAEFLDWLATLESARVAVWNPPELVRANVDKSYLRALAGAGVPVLPTVWLARGSRADLGVLLETEGWSEAVVKPAVSASAHRTWRTSRAAARDEQRVFEELVAEADVLVQSYAPEVCNPGEWSFVFLGGAFSHAVLKRPAHGDFRVQTEFGGDILAVAPPDGLVAQAQEVMARIHGPWLYARVDGIERDRAFVLMELELTEPALFLGEAPHAAGRFAEAILEATPLPRWPG